MKKAFLVLTVLLAVMLALASCGGSETTTTANTDANTTPAGTVATTPKTPAVSTPADTTKNPGVTTPWIDPNVEPIVTDDYTAIPHEFEWVVDNSVDFSKFTYSGTGMEISQTISRKYNGWTKNYIMVDADGKTVTLTNTEVKKLTTVGAIVTEDKAAKAVDILLQPIEAKLESSWASVTAKAGGYLMFDFTTNLTSEFCVTVTDKAGGSASSAVYKQPDITVKGENGTYTGIAKCTVPQAVGKTYYINICLDNGTTYPVMTSIPVTVTPPKYESEFSLLFEGDWELVKREDYLSDLIDLFYNAYPRLYARWGVGDPNVPKTITFVADKNYDGVAYCAGTIVCVSTNYANQAPYDIGFFSHEITHSVQQYGGKLNYDNGGTYNGVTYDAWWTENMASYGGFRYFHWGYSTKYIQFYDAEKFKNWGENYEGYGDGCQVFLSYLDWKFPTIDKNGNGKADPDELGVIDRINYVIKNTEKEIYDTPTNPNTPFSKAVYDATGGKYDCLDAIRAVYKEDIESGAFRVTGFRDYKDNWITENIQGVPNPTYPMWEPAVKGDKTNPALEALVLEGNNLAKGATIVEFSAEASRNPIANLLDGDVKTFWHGSASSIGDYKYQLKDISHSAVIDLGEVKNFNTYTLVNRGYDSSNKLFNTKEWEILISEDGKTWTSVDYQKDNTADAISVNVGAQSARYIELRIYTPDKSNTGNVRIQEFMIFDQK